MSVSSSATIEHGYPHLRQIHRAIADLHRRFPRGELLGLRFPSSLSPSIIAAAKSGDAVISTQRIAAAIVHHFHLPTASVVVHFRGNLETPAKIELSRDKLCIVEMQDRYRQDRTDTVAILAHEIAHLFLDRAHLSYSDTLNDEILTDTASVYLGAGWSVLNAYHRRVTRSTQPIDIDTWQTTTTTTESKVGYLTPEEFGYVLARRCAITHEHVAQWIESDAGRAAFAAGLAQLHRELASPPLATCSRLRRMRYKYAVWKTGLRKRRYTTYDCGAFAIEVTSDRKIVFHCPICTQKLRLPVGIKSARVHCTTCGESFECSS